MKNAYVLEFGIKGGAHKDNLVFPSLKIAVETACALVHVFTGDACHPSAKHESWWIASRKSGKRVNRETWESATHFVAISKLGKCEGSASSTLWKRKGLQAGEQA